MQIGEIKKLDDSSKQLKYQEIKKKEKTFKT
jgi:hypothetical protein